MAELTIAGADGNRHRFPIAKDTVTVGRARSSDIFLPDQWLSRHHAEIRRRGEDFYLHDLSSKNGTLLNGERVRDERRLRHGDVVSLGEHHLTFLQREEAKREEEADLEGTRMFSARDLSDIQTKPSVDPEELRRQNRVLGVLSTAARELLEHRPLQELFGKVLDLLFEAVPAQRGAILVLEGVPPQPAVKATLSRHGPPITRVSRSIARRVTDDLKSVLIPNIFEDESLRTQDSIMATGIRSAICAPLWYTAEGRQDTVLGLVYMDSLLGSHDFNEEDLQIVTALANVAAAKIENVRLLEESLEKRRLEADMQVAAEIQRSLLPGAPPPVPGYDLCGANFPCRTVGGDYFDYDLDGDALLLGLGDVSGKGTGAALLMTVLRAAVRDHWGDGEPGGVVTRINRTVCANVPPNKYVTFVLGRLDLASGVLTYVNAGHNAPVLVRADGRTECLEEGGTVLGLFEGETYRAGTATLEEGDVLLIYSDGVTETWDPDEEEFGEQRLAQLVVRERHRDARSLQAAILAELETFARGEKATDDRTLIVLKRAPASSES
jgi:serine phosphatase RsbU (regulator of sigma subunit)